MVLMQRSDAILIFWEKTKVRALDNDLILKHEGADMSQHSTVQDSDDSN